MPIIGTIPTVIPYSGTLPVAGGVASAGVSNNVSRGDHVHPATTVIASSVENTPAGNIAATNVQAAINELDTEKAPLANPVFSGNVGINVVGGSARLEVGGNNADNAIASRSTYEGTLKIDDPYGATLQSSAGLEFKCSMYGSGYGVKILAEADGTLLIGNRANSKDWTLRAKVSLNGDVLVTSPALLGYGLGAGGTVIQATSRATLVTLNKPSGQIQMFSAAGSATWSWFQVINSLVTVESTITLSVVSGASNVYVTSVANVANGSFLVVFATTGGTAVDAPIINFTIEKGSAS